MSRTYLDNAATSWPKPEAVYAAVDQYQRELGVAAGRGSYRTADEVARVIGRVRLNLAKLLGTSSPNRIVFTQNCTDSLNIALHGLLRERDHVITSVAEHNSILRPLADLTSRLGLEVTTVRLDESGAIDLEDLAKSIRNDTALIAMTHASNVTGKCQPISEIARIAKENDTLLLVDAAQTVGHVELDVIRDKIDLLAAPGHKGLLGPLGTGFLYVAEGVEQHVRSIRQGGTGTQSESPEQPGAMPEKFESGNMNVPGLVGLDAGVQYAMAWLRDGADNAKFVQLTEKVVEGMAKLSGVSVYSEANPVGIVGFNLDGYDPQELSLLLDSAAGIEVRAGLHCAPLMHRHLGTYDGGGCVRASFGHWSTEEDVTKLLAAVKILAENPIG